MNAGRNLRMCLSLVIGCTSLVAVDAHAFRSEYDAYEACRTAIKRGFDEWQTLDFGREYGRASTAAKGVYEFFINLQQAAGGRRVPYRARCSAEGFGAVEDLQVEHGRWKFE